MLMAYAVPRYLRPCLDSRPLHTRGIIVAAVLGVVLTMGKINGPPTELGQSIGAAWVGTFTGILLCCGYVGPMAANLELKAQENETLLVVIKTAIVASVNEAAPPVALKYGRRAISGDGRPKDSGGARQDTRPIKASDRH